MKLVQSILILPRPPRARGEVSHLMIGLRLPGEVRDGRFRNGANGSGGHGWKVLAGLPGPNSYTLAFRFGSARKRRF